MSIDEAVLLYRGAELGDACLSLIPADGSQGDLSGTDAILSYDEGVKQSLKTDVVGGLRVGHGVGEKVKCGVRWRAGIRTATICVSTK